MTRQHTSPRVLLMFSVLVLAMAAATSTIRPAHAAGSLFVGLSRVSQLSIGSTFTVEVNVSSIDLFETWDISVQTNPNVITPTLITTTGDIFGSPTEFVNCVNGVGVGCGILDTVGIAHSSATSPSGVPVSGNGLLFNITYTVVGAGYSDISFPPFTYASQILYVGNLVTHSTFNGVYGVSPFDYSLSNNGPVSVMQGGSSPVTITATLTAAAAAPAVALSCAALTLPSGIICGSSTVTPTLTGAASDLLVTAAPTLAKGSYTVQVTGSPAGATAFGAVTNVTVTVVAPFDYSLSNNGPVSIQEGSSGHVTISATLKTGTASPVRLSCVSSSLPSGITCASFNPSSVTPTSTGATSDLTVNVASSVTPRSVTIQVTGSPLGPTTTPTSVSVTVTPLPFDYSLSNNGPVSITRGGPGTVTITATLTSGTAQPVTLSCPNNPPGITCGMFSVNPVTPAPSPGATSVLTINVASSVAAGSYSFQVTGSPAGATASGATTTVSVTVTTVDTTSISVSCTPSTIVPTATSSCTVTVTDTTTASNTPTGSVTFVSSNTAVGTVPASCTLSSGQCTFTFTGVAEGTATVTGTYGGDSTHQGSIGTSNTITVAKDFTTTTVGNISCNIGLGATQCTTTATATVTDTTNPSNVPGGSVTFALTAGTTGGNLGADSCTLSATGSCSVAFSATTPGAGSMTATYGGDATHRGSTSPSATVTVTASGPFDYSLSNSGPVSIQQGNSRIVTITATLTGSTTQHVTLSCVSSTLPSGITCGSFATNPVTPYSTGTTSDLTISVASSLAAATYSFQVTGSPAGTTASGATTTVSVTVTAAVTTTSPPPILGLPPTVFYSIVGVVVIIVVALTVLTLRRRGRTP